MMLGCICGGVLELVYLVIFAAFTGVSTYVCTSLYNIKAALNHSKKCQCKCHTDDIK